MNHRDEDEYLRLLIAVSATLIAGVALYALFGEAIKAAIGGGR